MFSPVWRFFVRGGSPAEKGRDSPNRVTPSLIFVHAEEVTPGEGT